MSIVSIYYVSTFWGLKTPLVMFLFLWMHLIYIFIANYFSVTHGFFQEMVFIDIYSFNFNGRQNEGKTNFLTLWIFNEPFVP